MYAQHAGGPHEVTAAVAALLAREEAEGLRSPERYARFAEDVMESKRALLELLIRLRREGKHVVGYGAPGKANTLLNYCGIRTDLLDYTVDRNPYKHGLFTPGTHIPIHPPEMISRDTTGLRRRVALEPARRDLETARLHREVGRAPDRPDSDGEGRRVDSAANTCQTKRSGARRRQHYAWTRPVKVVIFAGGFGVRMGEQTQRIPKPIIRVGEQPILWHIMKYYASWGHKDFILCLGYKAETIKEYFLSYNEALANDFVLSNGGRSVELLGSDISDWRITFVDTGAQSTIGDRLRLVAPHLGDDEYFLATYGDGVTDAPLPDMIERLQDSGKMGIFLSTRPMFTAHVVSTDWRRRRQVGGGHPATRTSGSMPGSSCSAAT